MEHRDRDNRNAPPPSTQTSRALPTHTTRAGSTAGGSRPSKTANVEGPIVPGTFVTQRFERNADGEMFERKVAADLIVLLDAIVESKGYTAKIRVDAFDAIWARYDAGDYGTGDAAHAVYTDLETLPPVSVIGSTAASQRMQLADAS
jgi:hypothetical protein